MQADTAVVSEIVENRYPFSQVKDANVLVFPSLESANVAYKLLARLEVRNGYRTDLARDGRPYSRFTDRR